MIRHDNGAIDVDQVHTNSTWRPRIMASILRVNTLTDASSNNSIATSTVFSGSAKAWAKIAANGASILDSFNVSSHDDDGTGDGGIHINNDMDSANYVIQLTVDHGGASSSVNSVEVTDGTQTQRFF